MVDHKVEIHTLGMVKVLVGKEPKFLRTFWSTTILSALDRKPPDVYMKEK